MEEKLFDILAEVLCVDPEELTAETSSEDYESWDSLAQLMIIEAIENQFEVSIPIEDAAEATSVEALLDLINEL